MSKLIARSNSHMTQGEDLSSVKLSSRDWLGLIVLLFGHAFVVFSALLFWTNRIVSLEVRMANVEDEMDVCFPELKKDIKEILKRLPRE